MDSALTKSKQARMEMRLPDSQKNMFERAAILGGYRSLSDYVISTLHQKSLMIIEENERIIASNRDREVFIDALTNPSPPNKALVSAANKYKEASNK